MKKVSFIAFASVTLAVLYWMEYAVCWQKSHKIDESFVEMVGRQSLFSDHIIWFTTVGLLLPSALIFSIVISYIYEVDPRDIDEYITIVPSIGYILIVLLVIGSMIFMIPSLFDQSRPGLIMGPSDP